MTVTKSAGTALTFTEHLAELRTRLIRIIVILFIAVTCLYALVPSGFGKMGRLLPEGLPELFYFSVTDAFTLRIKLAFFAAIVLTSPYLFWEISRFIGPGLTPKEKKLLRFGFTVSGIFFLAGAAIGFSAVIFRFLPFFIRTSRELFSPVLSADKTIGLVLSITVLTGAIFLIPGLLFFLSRAGLLKSAVLKKSRWLFLAVVTGLASLAASGSDILFLLLLSLPVVLFYETILWVLTLREKRNFKKDVLDE